MFAKTGYLKIGSTFQKMKYLQLCQNPVFIRNINFTSVYIELMRKSV